jgi:hypothetical protein
MPNVAAGSDTPNWKPRTSPLSAGAFGTKNDYDSAPAVGLVCVFVCITSRLSAVT